MSSSTDFIGDLLAGRRTHVDDAAPRGPGVDTRGAPQLLDDLRAFLDELARERAADPEVARATLAEVLHEPSITAADVDGFLETWRTAVDDPDSFDARVRGAADRGIVDWWHRLRGYVHRPIGPTDEQAAMLKEMRGKYRLPSHPLAPAINPNERQFEDPDPVWISLWRAHLLAMKHWPQGLVTMPRHSAQQSYVYSATAKDGTPLPADRPISIGLLADFGTGYYHSWGIAEQLAAWAHPYVFHLGDVYYGGSRDEFSKYFERPLYDVTKVSRVLGMPENHELYAGGQPYLDCFQKRYRPRGVTPQDGTYFCVRFPQHQIIAAEVNWQGRQQYRDPDLAKWLHERIAEGKGMTTILLTGSAPFVIGASSPRQLLADLYPFLVDESVGLWFWGDDHYCALFDRNADVPFYGSCIGHGGFPGTRQAGPPRPTYKTSTLWVEDQGRFPAWTKMRPDRTNNGWCQLTLQPDGGVDLLYVDWLWCKRAAATFKRAGTGLQLIGHVGLYDREATPVLHQPPPK